MNISLLCLSLKPALPSLHSFSLSSEADADADAEAEAEEEEEEEEQKKAGEEAAAAQVSLISTDSCHHFSPSLAALAFTSPIQQAVFLPAGYCASCRTHFCSRRGDVDSKQCTGLHPRRL